MHRSSGARGWQQPPATLPAEHSSPSQAQFWSRRKGIQIQKREVQDTSRFFRELISGLGKEVQTVFHEERQQADGHDVLQPDQDVQ